MSPWEFADAGGDDGELCIWVFEHVTGTFNVVKACRAEGVHHVVFASSVQVYGVFSHKMRRADGRHAYVSTTYVPIDESHPQTPVQPYALSKKLGEDIGRAYVRAGSIRSFVAMRYTGILREIGPPRVLPQLIAGSMLSYVHLTEAAVGMQLAVEAAHAGRLVGFRAYNVVARRPRFEWTR